MSSVLASTEAGDDMSLIEVESSPAVTPIEIPEPNEAQQILLAARDLIADKSKWCTGLRKRERVCAVGAVAHVLGLFEQSYEEADVYWHFDNCPVAGPLGRAAREINDCIREDAASAVFEVNDRLGHEATMRMFNRAIELAGQRA